MSDQIKTTDLAVSVAVGILEGARIRITKTADGWLINRKPATAEQLVDLAKSVWGR